MAPPLFACAIHNQTFPTRTRLLKHLSHKRHRIETSADDVACPVCILSFASVEALEAHNAISHPGNGGHCCAGCRKGFKSVEKLGRHMQKRRKKCGIAAGDAGDGAEETKRSGEKRKHDRIEEATVEEGRQVQAEDDDTSGLFFIDCEGEPPASRHRHDVTTPTVVGGWSWER